MTPPATAPLLLAPLFERTGPLPVPPSRGGRHRAPTRGWRRQIGRALIVLALVLAPRRPTRTETR